MARLNVSLRSRVGFLYVLYVYPSNSYTHFTSVGEYSPAYDSVMPSQPSEFWGQLGTKSDKAEQVPQTSVSCCWRIQSEDIATPVMENTENQTETKQQQMTFLDETQQEYSDISAPIVKMDGLLAVDLAKFLSRPVKIFTRTWAQSDSAFVITSFFPWSDFLNTDVIKNKLHNFGFIRGNIKLKVVVNASPFLYGFASMFYQPLYASCPLTIENIASEAMMVPYSQRNHVTILPHMSAGGEMKLPFLYQKNWLELNTGSHVQEMGRMDFIQYTPLRSANGATTSSATIAVYAWMEDVELSATTCSLSLQSRDEYGTGPISQPAHAMANAATRLATIPAIAPFALASSYGLRAFGKIASLFGFTNTPVISNVAPYAPMPVPNLATSEVGYPVDKLTLDPKTELSIDPTICGDQADDTLRIAHIVQRESFIQATTWTTANTVNNILLEGAITPCMWRYQAVTSTRNYNRVQLTPMAHVSQLFSHWRGDVILRFRIICSQYHKGRLLFSFDPAGDNTNNLNGTADPSAKTYSQIIDISSDTDVEIRVPYSQAAAWASVTRLSNNPQNYIFPNSGSVWPIDLNYPTTNGMFTLRVLNTLTAPVDTSTVQILCFIRGAENLEFANPWELPQDYSTLQVQSKDVPVLEHSEGELDGIYKIHFGEPVLSLRQLMHRYSRSYMFAFPGTLSGLRLAYTHMKRLPRARGYDPYSSTSGLSALTPATYVPYSFVVLHPLVWIGAAFIGVRGSSNIMVTSNLTEPLNLYVSRNPQQNTLAEWTTSAITPGTSISTAYNSLIYSNINGQGGASVAMQRTRQGLVANLPDCSGVKFESTTHAFNMQASALMDWKYKNFTLSSIVNSDRGADPVNTVLDVWYGAGTDLHFIYYLNAPVVYQCTNPTPQA